MPAESQKEYEIRIEEFWKQSILAAINSDGYEYAEDTIDLADEMTRAYKDRFYPKFKLPKKLKED